MLLKLVRAGKNILLPKGKKHRTLPFGLAAGCVMQVDFHKGFAVYLGLYEKELEKSFRRLVRQGNQCFDVGGRGGYDALMLAKLSGSKVVSFECDMEAVAEMRETFARNQYPIDIVKGFVSDSDEGDKVTLDTVAEKTFIPDFIKIDIEGAEAHALYGAKSILSTRKPSMIIEIHSQDLERECIDILQAHGYNPEVVDQRRFFKEDRPLIHNRWLVCEGNI